MDQFVCTPNYSSCLADDASTLGGSSGALKLHAQHLKFLN